jgi:hypothetical protein
MNNIRAAVYNDKVLGCLSSDGKSIEPLSDLRRTSTTNHSSPIAIFNGDDIKPATLEDFKRFRVHYHDYYVINWI